MAKNWRRRLWMAPTPLISPHIVNLTPLPPSKLATLFMDGPKDENTVGEKMARNGPKRPFILSDSFPIQV